MFDKRYDKYAQLIVDRSLEVKEGMNVMIMGTTEAKPLMLSLQKELLKKGAFPYFNISFPESEEIKYKYASDYQLRTTGLIELFVSERYDAILLIHSEDNPVANSRVDIKRQMLSLQSMGQPMQNVMSRVAQEKMKWSSCIFPSRGLAQLANMGQVAFEEMILDAVKLNDASPIKTWEIIEKEQQKLIDYLSDKDKVHIIGEDTDLTFSVKGRKWINCSGRSNLPDGEIYTGPIEDSVNGHIYFKHQIMYKGNIAKGVRLRFENGKCINATAETGEAFLNAMINLDDGASYVGEFALGLNENLLAPASHILIDEKIGGTVHIALGNGLPLTGSKNKSALHWDFICDLRENGQIIVDEEVIMKNGEYLICKG